VINDNIQIRMHCLRQVLLLEALEEAGGRLEDLMQECVQEREHLEVEEAFRLDAPVLLLIAQGAWYRICRKDLLCPFTDCEDKINSTLGLLTHLNKKHDLTGLCCKDHMRHLLDRPCPRKIHTRLKAGDGEIATRP
jgi:hypothetical protein